jgi:cyclase
LRIADSGIEMNFVKTSIVAALAAAVTLAPVAAPAQATADVSIDTVDVADGIYMLIGQGGNIGVAIGPDGAFVIDDQFAPLTEKITAAIAALTDQPVTMVINTHWHGDHTGGNENLASAGALIVAHDNVRERMNSTQISTFFERETPPANRMALPVLTFDQSVTFHLNGKTIRAEHVEHAHTDGDSIIWFIEDNVVHMGDTFFNGFYPFIDVDSGGSVAGMIEAVDRVLAKIDEQTKIMPGHGPMTDINGLIDYRDMLRTVSGRIAKMIETGKSRHEIVAARPTDEFDEDWGKGFIKPDQWVELIHASMTKMHQ